MNCNATLFRPLGFVCLLMLATLAQAAPRLAVYSDGRRQWVAAPAAGDIAETKPHARTNKLAGQGVQFTITYADVTAGASDGFNDPTLGAARRAVLEQVLSDLGRTILDHDGATAAVLVQRSFYTGAIYSYGGSYFDSTDGMMDSDSQKAIAQGIDDWPTYADLLIGVDFSFNYYLGNATPAANQFDLYSKIMASAVRALGVLSMCAANGGSEDLNGYQLRTRWDEFLEIGNGTRLFDPEWGDFNGTSAWLTGGAGGVWFAGPRAVARYGNRLPLYAPNPFELDNSMTGWAPAINDSGAVLTIRPPDTEGVLHREPRPWELGALEDLGYRVHHLAADPAWLAVE